MTHTASVTVTIANKKGLHARAAAKFVKVVEGFDAKVTVTRSGQPPALFEENGGKWSVPGCSILGLMMLGAEPGAELLLSATGKDAQSVCDALAALVAQKFGEES